jgi:hypothetical protein
LDRVGESSARDGVEHPLRKPAGGAVRKDDEETVFGDLRAAAHHADLLPVQRVIAVMHRQNDRLMSSL